MSSSTVAKQPKSLVAVTVTVTPAEMVGYFEAAVQELSGQITIPGFRRGKVPRPVLETRVGKEYLAQQAIERAVADSYYRAVKEHGLQPIARPETDLGDQQQTETKGLTYVATVPVLPPVDLGDYRKIKVKPVASDFKLDQVEEALDQLRRSRASEAQVDRPANTGDRVEIDFVGKQKGKEFPGGKSENHPLVIGEDTFIPGFADQLIGLAAGQVKTFKLKFPKDYREASLAGQTVEFTVTMRQIKETKLPELDDAFAGQFGAKSLTALKERLTANLKEEKQREAERQTQAAVVDRVVDQAKAELPQALIEQELDRMIAEMRQQIERQGIPYDKYLEHLKKTEAEIRGEVRDQAARRVKTSLVLNTIQDAESLQPTEAQIKAELNEQLAGAKTAEDKEQLQTDEFRQYLTRILGNRLVVEYLVKQATGG